MTVPVQRIGRLSLQRRAFFDVQLALVVDRMTESVQNAAEHARSHIDAE